MNRGAGIAGEHQRQISRERAGHLCGTARIWVSSMRPAMPSHVVSASALPCAFGASRAVAQPRSRGVRHRGWARYRCACAPARDARRCSGRISDIWGCVSLPCSMSVARVTSPARSRVLHMPSRLPHIVASERALATALAAALDGVCDNATRGQAVRACSRNEWSSAEQERAVCGAAEKRKRSVDGQQEVR